MIKASTGLTLLCLLAAPSGEAAGAPLGEVRTDGLVALSLAGLQKHLKAGDLDPELPLPMSRIVGAFLDKAGGDIVLLGRREPSAPRAVPIVPDDIAVAAQAMWLSDQPPGVSIDPQEDPARPGAMGPFQRVVYFGRLANSRPGLYAFRCDYWMKRLAAGAAPSPLPGFARYADLAVARGDPRRRANRFWFYPRMPRVVVSPAGDLMLLEQTGVEVLTEAMHSLLPGARTHRVYMGRDPIAERFAGEFTERYGELAAVYPDLSRLGNFFALCQALRWAEDTGLGRGRFRPGTWKYLLHDYVPVPTHCPTRVPTMTTRFRLGGGTYELSGGVSAEVRLPSKPRVDSTGRLASLAYYLASAAPAKSSPFWMIARDAAGDDVLKRVQRALANGRSLSWLRRHGQEAAGALAIEAVGEGRAAVLYRSGPRLLLAHVNRGSSEAVAAGADARTKFAEMARTVCRRASDARLAFVHIHHEGGGLVFQVGDRRDRFSIQEITSFLGGKPPGERLERLFLGERKDFGIYRDGLAVAGPAPHSGGRLRLDDPALWTIALQRHFRGRLRFYLTDDPAQALRNHRRARSSVAAADLAVLIQEGTAGASGVSGDTLRSLAAAGIRIAHSSGEVGGGKHLLLITSRTSQQVLADLRLLGDKGLLKGKLVILYGADARIGLSQAQELIDDHGMVGVVHHLEAVEPFLLNASLEHLVHVLSESARDGQEVGAERVLLEAAQRASQAMRANTLLDAELSKLHQAILQI